jgi:hypothetical protein
MSKTIRLVIVLAIIALLVGVLVPVVKAVRHAAQEAEARNTPAPLPNVNTPPAAPVPPVKDGPFAPREPAYTSQSGWEESMDGMPYAPGWPLALPGQVIGTPVVADVVGDGTLQIIVPTTARDPNQKLIHPVPNETALLWAIRFDGTTVPGWPVEIGPEQNGSSWGGWASSPSVFRRNGKDEIIVNGGKGGGIRVVRGNRTSKRLAGGDACVNVPLADLNGDGVMDIAQGGVLTTVDGGPVTGWPASLKFRNGYSPCIGDAAGDGQLRLYHLFYTTSNTDHADLTCVDVHGEKLPGWPRQIQDASWLPPVMGDITGDDKMEIVATYSHHLYAWHHDGQPVANTTTEGQLVGILKNDVEAVTSCPALADLDGDGKAEIIIFDDQSHGIRAWHGDGTPAFASEDNAFDGLIAKLPPTAKAHGVSVVSLGDDPKAMDFFTGTYWVRRTADGKVTITNMLPADEPIEWTQPTVTDVNADGKADVIFGTSTGRLAIYQTNLAYHPERMQWPTANGNFQHTGSWKKR